MKEIKTSKLFMGALAINVGWTIGKLISAGISGVGLAIAKNVAPNIYNDVLNKAGESK
jgi:hypothetical protein